MLFSGTGGWNRKIFFGEVDDDEWFSASRVGVERYFW